MWLRAIQRKNNEDTAQESNPHLAHLQCAAKLSNFDVSLLVSKAKFMADQTYLMHIERKEGHAKGLAEDRAEGQVEARKEMALSLRNQSVSISTISAASGLSEQEILALK